MSEWFLDVFPSMRRKLANEGCGQPGDDRFPTAESWQDWLNATADVLESLQEENWESRNEFAEQFFNDVRVYRLAENGNTVIRHELSPESDEISQLYMMRAQELQDERNALLIDTFNEIGKNFDCLWD